MFSASSILSGIYFDILSGSLSHICMAFSPGILSVRVQAAMSGARDMRSRSRCSPQFGAHGMRFGDELRRGGQEEKEEEDKE